MKALRTALLAGSAVLLAAGSAFAAETISLSADWNGTSLGTVSNVSGGSATVSGNGLGVVFSVTSLGVPSVPSPDFATVTLDANVSNAGGGTLTILATQQNLTNFLAGSFASTFAADFLIGNANVAAILMTSWVDPGNGAFVQTNLLGSQLCFGAANNCAPQTDFATVLGLGTFSETEKFVISFTGPAGISGNAQISAAVPEPATWGMMLLGFLGLGAAFRKRRSIATLAA